MNNEEIVKKYGLFEWVKRLGQQHYSIIGTGQTLCGKPMLGNNYAKHLFEEQKEPCRDCAVEMRKLGTPEQLKEAVWESWIRSVRSDCKVGQKPHNVFDDHGFSGEFTGLDKHMSTEMVREALEKLDD